MISRVSLIRALVSLFSIACLVAPTRAEEVQGSLQSRAIEFEGTTRTYFVYIPSTYGSREPAPLLVALHGRFSSPNALEALSELSNVGERRGAVVVYPSSAGGFWNEGGHATLGRNEPAHDDVGFVAAVIADVGRTVSLRADRVFVAGYDSGGGLAYALACDDELQLAGVAIVSALMWDFQRRDCARDAPIPILIIHGARDEYYPSGGGRPVGLDVDARRLSASETSGFWREKNRCGPEFAARSRGSVFQNCAAPFAFIEVPGGNHVWFSTSQRHRLNAHNVDATAGLDAFLFDIGAFALPVARSAGNSSRSFIVYAPSAYHSARETPLVILLHGRPSNASAMARITQMNAVAERQGFLVAYPDGLDSEWNLELEPRDDDTRLLQDDVGFLETLVADLAVDFNVDQDRVFLGGFSNGGFMTHRVACSSRGPFAALAVIGAPIHREMTRNCLSEQRFPIAIIHGTADPSVPYAGVVSGRQVRTAEGFRGRGERVTLSVPETVRFYIQRNGCEERGSSMALSSQTSDQNVIRFEPANCQNGNDIAFFWVNGGGHTWPGVPGLDSAQFGPTNMDFNAGESIWSFFEAHPRGGANRP